MLEYLDDIIGSSRYNRPLKLYTLKLELVTEKRESQVNRVNLVETERLNMVGPVRELLNILVLDNKIAAVRNKIYSLKSLTYSDRLEHMNPEKDVAKKNVEDKQKELEELLIKIKEQKKTISKHQREVEKQKSLINAIQENLNSENLRFQKCENEIKKLTAKKTEKEKELSKEEKKVSTLKEKPQKNSDEIENLQKELEEVKNILDEKVPELNNLLSECQKKTTKMNCERDRVGEELAEKKKIENDKNAALTLAQSKKIQMTDEADRLDSRLNNAKRSVDDLQEKLEAKEK